MVTQTPYLNMSDPSIMFAGVVLFAFLIGVLNASKDLALHKSATQSSTLVMFDAGKAVDGIAGHDVDSRHCSHTELGHSEAWWMVDLGQVYRIQTINITYRYSHYAFRLSGFYLYVSNTSFHDISTDQRSHWHLCYHDDIADPDLLPSTNQSRPCPVNGQYVIVYNKRPADNGPKNHEEYSTSEAVIELCEVQVFGCPFGKFGDSCNLSCHCEVKGCNSDTGKCDVTGCQTGWMGDSCSTACAARNFGADCKEECHCATVGCDRLTGNCTLPGCEAGWEGPSCDQVDEIEYPIFVRISYQYGYSNQH